MIVSIPDLCNPNLLSNNSFQFITNTTPYFFVVGLEFLSVSLWRDSSDVNLVGPVTIRAVSFRIFSARWTRTDNIIVFQMGLRILRMASY